MADYLIPAGEVTVEQYVKKSQFICRLAHCNGREAAMEFIRSIADQHRDANHNCWAFVASAPGDASGWGMNDDGEPKGCAGKPMFNVIHHHGAGEICAVVTRYFGGIKLGTGGMARAYSSTVKLALDEMEFIRKVHYTSVSLVLPYTLQKSVERLVEECDGVLLTTDFRAEVTFQIDVPQQIESEFIQRINDLGRGGIVINAN